MGASVKMQQELRGGKHELHWEVLGVKGQGGNHGVISGHQHAHKGLEIRSQLWSLLWPWVGETKEGALAVRCETMPSFGAYG